MITVEIIRAALQCNEPGCACHKPRGLVHCPGHADSTPSLSVTEKDGKILVKDFGGCSQEALITALKERDLWLTSERVYGRKQSSGKGCNRATATQKPKKNKQKDGCENGCTQKSGNATATGLTLAQLSEAKGIPLDFLQKCGVSEVKRLGETVVRIPYMNQAREVVALRYRLSLDGAQRFAWRKGDRVLLYGLWLLEEIRRAGWCLLEEGESDFWTCGLHGIPALGLPGKGTWRREWGELLRGIQVFLWQESDAPELPDKVIKDIPGLMVIPAPDGLKDINQAHLNGQNVPALVEQLKAAAIPARLLLKAQQDARLKELAEQAQSILISKDPLNLITQAVKGLGFGGDPTPVLITYLSITSRLLAMRRGAMPVHLLLLAQSSAGKNYALSTALLLFPSVAYHGISAGSPRVLIYDDADLQHRAVIFGEADSLPAGEDNPAASAIRNLAQDHYLHYKVTIKDPVTGNYIVREVEKPGPTVLITTSTRRLGHQLDTRLFSLEVNDGKDQIKTALDTQADIELEDTSDPDPQLIAFQEFLQLLAPWQVVVPYVRELAAEIGKKATAPRIMRDFARLISLVKAGAIMRHRHRGRDTRGRVMATLEDYGFVYDLVAPMYESSLTGASQSVREAVQAVADLGEGVTAAVVARHLQINKATAWRRAKVAINQGWLINAESRKSYPAILKLGDPLPEREGLPTPETVAGCISAKSAATANATAQPVENTDDLEDGCTVAPDTDDLFPPLDDLQEVIL